MSLHLNKTGLRVLGIAESFRRSFPTSVLAGVVMRGDLRIDGLAYANATVGGDDATNAVLRINKDLDRADLNAVMISGVAVSWFNIIDLQEVYDNINKPLISVTYEESPGLEDSIREFFPIKPEEKLHLYSRLGKREAVRLKTGYDVYIRAIGVSAREVQILLNKFTLDGRVPEPVRVARLAARAAINANLDNL